MITRNLWWMEKKFLWPTKSDISGKDRVTTLWVFKLFLRIDGPHVFNDKIQEQFVICLLFPLKRISKYFQIFVTNGFLILNLFKIDDVYWLNWLIIFSILAWLYNSSLEVKIHLNLLGPKIFYIWSRALLIFTFWR